MPELPNAAATTTAPSSRRVAGGPRRVDRAFWVVSLIIAMSDALLIYFNYHSTHAVVLENLTADGVRQETTFQLNLRNQGLQMQQFAAYLANQPAVQALFVEGRRAVEQEGGGRGGERAAALRQRLFDLISPGWQKITGDYQVRQLHFHLGPGDTSFLRVHEPSKFGDDLSSVRHTITHAIRNNEPTQGFESGRVYPGIRGVVPITTDGDQDAPAQVVGALEAGSSFAQMLQMLETDTGTLYAVLMTEAHFRRTHWPAYAAQLLKQRPLAGEWFIEATSDEPTVRQMLKDREVTATLGGRQAEIVRINGTPYGVYSFPFRDFLRTIDPSQPPIGMVVAWRDASGPLAAADKTLKTNLAIGAFGFLVVEILLFTAWSITRGRLQRAIDNGLSELSQTNGTLQQEVARREHSEAKLRDYQGQLELIVAQRTHSLSETVDALQQQITQRQAAEQALQYQRDQAQVTLRSIVDGVITTDAQCRVQYLNPAAEQLTGWTLAEAAGMQLGEVFDARDMDRSGSRPAFASCLAGDCEQQHSENTELTRRDGKTLTVEHSTSRIRDESGRGVGLVLVFHDDTATRELAVQLSYQASHDALTGLVNRRVIEMELRDALRASRADDSEHAFLYVDLDQFKVVNDTCGHVAGDELLRQLTKLLQKKTRKTDCLARLGGDEFGLLLRDCGPQKARAIADGLLETLRSFRFVWEQHTFKIGASIGVASIDAQLESVEAAMSAADSACYLAKEKGRGRVHLSLRDDAELTTRRGEMQWVSRIQKAITDDRLVLFGQSIVPVHAGNHADMHQEILVRMLDENGELIAPNAFIPAAERYGIMPEIDRWIIGRAFQLMQRSQLLWPGNPEGWFSINLSGETMADDATLGYIREQLKRFDIDPRQVCFEVTETAAIANMSSAIDLMTELKGDGCRFALDDFGSGLSSFGYLKALPVDFLKIDGEFVRNLTQNPIDRVMVNAINDVGHAMNLRTIAEFVEDAATMSELRRIGVDYAQGYGVAAPVVLAVTQTGTD